MSPQPTQDDGRPSDDTEQLGRDDSARLDTERCGQGKIMCRAQHRLGQEELLEPIMQTHPVAPDHSPRD